MLCGINCREFAKMTRLRNLNVVNAVTLLLGLVVLTECVLGENYGETHQDYAARRLSSCDNLSPQNFIEMDHVRIVDSAACTEDCKLLLASSRPSPVCTAGR